jgi:mRNA-degrading endonuclease toxin of MazEF toxin-antitoxin module
MMGQKNLASKRKRSLARSGDPYPMSRYAPGDVVLVPFPHKAGHSAKIRPAVVVAVRESGDLCCCPIRSSPHAGTRCVPISIDDFTDGGLDLFSESYVQTDTVRTMSCSAVIGKKGKVTGEFLSALGFRLSL